jgi:iron-sulfur cluster assembly protein
MAEIMEGKSYQKADYLTLTSRAKEHIKDILKEHPDANGIRLCLKPQGCSGMKYSIEYAKEGMNVSSHDELFEEEGIKVFIDPKISLWIIGTTMDYQDDKVSSGFIFINPNEKGTCGCGESFYV